MWVWPQLPLEGHPLHPPPCTPGPLPHTRLGRPVPEHCKKSQGGWGEEEGRGGGGREGFWLEGRVLQLQWGMGGTLQTPVGARPTSGGSQLSSAKANECWSPPGVPIKCVAAFNLLMVALVSYPWAEFEDIQANVCRLDLSICSRDHRQMMEVLLIKHEWRLVVED